MVTEASGWRIALRPLHREDLVQLPQSIRGLADGELAEKVSGHDYETLAILLIDTGEPIAALSYQLGTPGEGWLMISRLLVADPLRGCGYGLEAVRLLEAVAVERGIARRFTAWVEKQDGLGLYFWLRLGYRPAGPDNVVWGGEDKRDMVALARGF